MRVSSMYQLQNSKSKYGLRFSGIVVLVLCSLLIGETAPAYQEKKISHGGSISGVVKFTGMVTIAQHV